MAGPPSLNSLPSDLTYMILDKIDNCYTLSSIVHASPQFHQVYLQYRRRILCQVILRQFKSVFALSEILSYTELPCDDEYLDFALSQGAHRHLFMRRILRRKSKPQKPHQPVLSIEECLAVLRYGSLISSNAVSMVLQSSNKLNPALSGYDCIFIGGVKGMEDCLVRLDCTGALTRWQWKVM